MPDEGPIEIEEKIEILPGQNVPVILRGGKSKYFALKFIDFSIN